MSETISDSASTFAMCLGPATWFPMISSSSRSLGIMGERKAQQRLANPEGSHPGLVCWTFRIGAYHEHAMFDKGLSWFQPAFAQAAVRPEEYRQAVAAHPECDSGHPEDHVECVKQEAFRAQDRQCLSRSC